MAKSALQKKLAERAENEEKFKLHLVKATQESLQKHAAKHVGFDKIVHLVRSFGVVEPLRVRQQDVGQRATSFRSFDSP